GALLEREPAVLEGLRGDLRQLVADLALRKALLQGLEGLREVARLGARDHERGVERGLHGPAARQLVAHLLERRRVELSSLGDADPGVESGLEGRTARQRAAGQRE